MFYLVGGKVRKYKNIGDVWVEDGPLQIIKSKKEIFIKEEVGYTIVKRFFKTFMIYGCFDYYKEAYKLYDHECIARAILRM